MKAIVCDKCGKTVLLPDVNVTCCEENGIYHMYSNCGTLHFDLCEDCANDLMAAVRERRASE